MGIAAAIGIAEVAFTVSAVLESIAIVGAVVSVVGTVTKSPVLSKIGLALGIVGGVGALAAGALGVGNVALFGTQTAESVGADTLAVSAIGSEAASGGVEAGTWTADAAAGGVGSVEATTGNVITDAISGLEAAPVGASDTLTLASTSENLADPALKLPGLEDAPATTASTTSTAAAPGTSANPLPGADAWGSPTNSADFQAGMTAGTKAADSGSGLGGALNKLVDYAGDHPVVAMGALQAGGSFLSSAFGGSVTAAQAAAYNAQAEANNAAAALTRQQTANLAMPKSVASSAPVTGTPQALVPQGFINQAAKAPAVTGVAA